MIIAACGSQTGASRFVFELARDRSWPLLASQYVLDEVEKYLAGAPVSSLVWPTLREQLFILPDKFSFDWISILTPAKDRPILFTAFSQADFLLTLDRGDFQNLIGSSFYGMQIRTPGNFVQEIVNLENSF